MSFIKIGECPFCKQEYFEEKGCCGQSLREVKNCNCEEIAKEQGAAYIKRIGQAPEKKGEK